VKLDFTRPRTIAAMKVTGILEQDLVAKPLSHYEKTLANPERAQQKFDMMERKRRQLIREVQVIEDTLDEDKMNFLLNTEHKAEGGGIDLTAEYKAMQDKAESQRREVKMELQKIIGVEITKKEGHEEALKKRQEKEKAFLKVQAEERAKLVERANLKKKKEETMAERLKSRGMVLSKARRELDKKLQVSSDRATQHVEGKTQEWESIKQERRDKMAQIAKRNLDYLTNEAEDKMEKHDASLQKQLEIDDRLARVLEEKTGKAAEKQEKFTAKMLHVAETLEARQVAMEDNLKKSLGNLADARKRRSDEEKVNVVDSIRAKLTKERERWTKNRDTTRGELRGKMKELKAKIGEDRGAVKDSQLEESNQERQEKRQFMEELVGMNKDRFRRSDDCEREKTLSKIQLTKDRIDSLIDQKNQVLHYRQGLMKETLVGQAQLNDMRLIIRDASPRKVNRLLKEMDMPPLQSGERKEGEQEENKV